MKIDVSNGEIVDKYTILQIKHEKGLDVTTELLSIWNAYSSICCNEILQHYSDILYNINLSLWDIEDIKRTKESTSDFDDYFILASRSVYILNDERARIKKSIDILTDSYLTETKEYARYSH